MLCIPWFRQCTSRKNGLSQTFSFPWKGKKCLWCGYREERFVSQHPDLRILADLHRKEKRADFTIPSFIIQFNQIQSNIYTTSSCMGKSEICNAFISPYMIHDTAFFQRNLMISQYYVDTQEAALLHESQHIPDAILQVQRKTFANIFLPIASRLWHVESVCQWRWLMMARSRKSRLANRIGVSETVHGSGPIRQIKAN